MKSVIWPPFVNGTNILFIHFCWNMVVISVYILLCRKNQKNSGGKVIFLGVEEGQGTLCS